ncbi:GreA/GreB family elongation factor [Candidatus Hodgkinia cicadicola]
MFIAFARAQNVNTNACFRKPNCTASERQKYGSSIFAPPALLATKLTLAVESKTTPITTAGYASLLKQLNWRQQHEKPRLKLQLQATRALGDLSENADHQASKQEDKKNENKINEIKSTLISTEVNPLRGKKGRIQFNSLAVLKSGEAYKTYYIVGETETVRDQYSINISSTVAQNIINKKLGDVVALVQSGLAKFYKIIYVKTW